MPFKHALPEERAGAALSASSAAASTFYDDDQSASYTTQGNAVIQCDLTRHALELLRASVAPCRSNNDNDTNEMHEPWLLLDVGAGSGLSTLAASEWLRERNVLGFTLAFDISASMLSLTAGETLRVAVDLDSDHSSAASSTDASAARAHCVQRAGFYRGNAAQRFPLRAGVFDAAIGISMLQWLNRKGLETCFASLYAQFGCNDNSSSAATAVFQIYPQSIDAVERMEQSARAMGFAHAEAFVSFPHAAAAKKWFLRVSIDSRHDSHSDSSSHARCLFGRRFDRRCAWHVLSFASDSTTVALRDRLGREHVKTAWHIWRKFRRAHASRSDVSAASNAKATRSLALWPSDVAIGQALAAAFGSPQAADTRSCSSGAVTITYALLLARMDDVVDLLHAAYADAAALEGRSNTSATHFDSGDVKPNVADVTKRLFDNSATYWLVVDAFAASSPDARSALKIWRFEVVAQRELSTPKRKMRAAMRLIAPSGHSSRAQSGRYLCPTPATVASCSLQRPAVAVTLQCITENRMQPNFQWNLSLATCEQQRTDAHTVAPTSDCAMTAAYAAVLEAVLLEGLESLAHWSLSALYPRERDRLAVVFDVWGLGDRDIIVTQQQHSR